MIRLHFLSSVLALGAAVCVSVLAQTAPAPRPAAANAASDAIVLNPFEVTAASTAGYLASEATTGSRYAAPVLEIPFPVSVITADFIEDNLAFDFNEAVAYVSSFTPAEGTGAFTTRGIRNASSTYLNGLKEGGIFGPVSVERIEIIKGPSASMYGQTEPSGLRNIVTKKARPTPFQSLRLSLGTDAFSRVALDVNQPLVKDKLLTRFAGSYEHNEQYAYDFGRYRRITLYNSSTWRIGPQTSLTYNAEYVKAKQHNLGFRDLPFVFAPVTLNGVTADRPVAVFGRGAYERFKSTNAAGPMAYNQVEYTQIDAAFSHAFNEVLSLRVLGGHYQRNQDIFNTRQFAGTNAANYSVTTGSLLGTAQPQLDWGRTFQDAVQADLLAQFKTGNVAHKILASFDYAISDGQSRSWRSSRADRIVNLDAAFRTGTYYSPTFPYNWDLGNRAVWDVRNGSSESQTILRGLMLTERISFLDGRVIALVGGRRDEAKLRQINFATGITYNGVTYGPGVMVPYPTQTGTTPQTGLVVKLTPGLSAYASYSKSFVAQRQDQATNIDAAGNFLPNQEGSGYEFGVKGSLLGNRLNFTFGWFDIGKTNVPRTARDAAGNPILIPGIAPGTTRQYSVVADIASRGLELDGNWQITDELSLLGGIGWNDVKYSKVPNPTEQFLVGIAPDNTPEWTVGLNGSYRPKRFLKGASLRAGVRYQDDMLWNNTTSAVAGDSGVKGQPLVVAGQRFETYFFRTPAYTVVDAGIGYTWRTRDSRLAHSVSLDFKNLLDKHYIRNRRADQPFAAIFSYEIKH